MNITNFEQHEYVEENGRKRFPSPNGYPMNSLLASREKFLSKVRTPQTATFCFCA